MTDIEHTEIVPVETWKQSPPAMLDRALKQQGIDPLIIKALMELAERWDATQARKAFDAALSSAKAELPVLRKNRKVDFTSAKGRTNYAYEDLGEVIGTIDPILSKHGLYVTFSTTTHDNGLITVTCRIGHAGGHYRENALPGMPDLTGNKNPIQAVGSTVTYLQRYTLKAALGLAAAGDDDGRASQEPEIITPEQLATLRALMVEAGVVEADFVANVLHIAALEDVYGNKVETVARMLREKKVANARAHK